MSLCLITIFNLRQLVLSQGSVIRICDVICDAICDTMYDIMCDAMDEVIQPYTVCHLQST